MKVGVCTKIGIERAACWTLERGNPALPVLIRVKPGQDWVNVATAKILAVALLADWSASAIARTYLSESSRWVILDGDAERLLRANEIHLGSGRRHARDHGGRICWAIEKIAHKVPRIHDEGVNENALMWAMAFPTVIQAVRKGQEFWRSETTDERQEKLNELKAILKIAKEGDSWEEIAIREISSQTVEYVE